MTRRKCRVRTCGRDHSSKGYCNAHATRLRQYGDVRADVPIRPRASRLADHCAVKTCTRTPIAKDYCAAHLYRWHQHGDPLAHIAIGDQDIKRLPRDGLAG